MTFIETNLRYWVVLWSGRGLRTFYETVPLPFYVGNLFAVMKSEVDIKANVNLKKMLLCFSITILKILSQISLQIKSSGMNKKLISNSIICILLLLKKKKVYFYQVQ